MSKRTKKQTFSELPSLISKNSVQLIPTLSEVQNINLHTAIFNYVNLFE